MILITLLSIGCAHGSTNAKATTPPPKPTTTETPAPPKQTATDEQCKAVYDTAKTQYDAKQLDAVVKTLRDGYQACGPGRGFLGAAGSVLAEQSKYDEGAALMIQEVLEPDPFEATFGALYDVLDKVSAPVKTKIVALGTDQAAPIHVPAISYEYKWVNSFVCGGKQAQNVTQSLISGKNGDLDELAFDCGDATKHAVYFDFSADPQEKEMRKQLGQ
jgi:hypothetical protein